MEEQKLQKRKRKAENENNQILLVSVCKDLAELYLKQGRHRLAIKEYEIIADIYKADNKRMEYAQANRAIGEAYMGLMDFENALEHQRLYLTIANEENNNIEQQRALATIGHIYLSWYLETQASPEKNLNSAYKYFMKSLRIAESLDGISKLERADMMARLFSNLGLVKESLDDFNKALELLNRSIAICKQHDIYEQLHRGYIAIASLYEKRKEYNEVIRHYNFAIDSAKKLRGKVDLMCAALLMKSDVLIKLSDLHSAKQVLLKAYKLGTPNIQEKMVIERNLRIVAVMCCTEDKLVMANGNEKERKELYEKMGDGACELKNYAKALEYYKLMLESAEKSGVSGRELASCYYSLAETYKDNEQYSEAVDYFEKEYTLCTDIKDRLNTLSNIADTKETGNAPVSEIRAVYERAFTDCRNSNNVKEERRMVSRCVAYLRRTNDHSGAFELNKYLDELPDVSFEDESSSSDGENSEMKGCMGDEINLEDLTDHSDDSDIENQQSTSKRRTVGRRKNLIVKKNAKGESQLHVACINGSERVVRHLVEQGRPVNIRDHAGWTPLHEASNYGFLEIVRFLLDKGACINDRGGTGCKGITPLYDAASNGHLKIVELLLDRGASPTAKTDDGDIALNVLQKWQRRNPLQGDDLILYRSLVKRMTDAMNIVGQSSELRVSVHGSNYHQSNEDITLRNHSRRDVQSRVLDIDENSMSGDDDASFSQMSSFDPTTEYRNVMGTLRNKSSNVRVSPAKRISQVPKRSALVVAEDDNIDDWLEDDLQASKSAKKRRTDSSTSISTGLTTPTCRPGGSRRKPSQPSPKKRISNEYEIPDAFFDDNFNDNFEDIVTVHDIPSPNNKRLSNERRSSNESRSSTGSSSSSKRKNQVSLLDAGFSRIRSNLSSTSIKRVRSFEQRTKPQQSKITNFGHRSLVEADSTTPVSSQMQTGMPVEQTQNQPIATGDLMVFVDVKIEGMVFRVPVLLSQVQTNTVGWLAEQAANKYARRECSKPTLELETTTGALLSDEDPLSLLFPLGATQAEPVVGRVVKLSLPPLADRYKEACALMNTDLDDFMCNLLEEVSVTLNISNRGILGRCLAPLCKALSHQSTLLELDLSRNFLSTESFMKLWSTLPTLVNLNTLNLGCTGLLPSHLAEFVKVFTSSTTPILQKLSSLDLSDNFLRDRSLPHLSRITAHLKLKTLILSNVKFTEDLFRDFDDDSLLNLSEIQTLDVSDNELKVEDIKRILWRVNISKMISLNISRCTGVNEGLLRALVDIFQDDICGMELQSLNLSRSNVQENEVYDFLRLCSKKSILDIDLSYNPYLTGISLRRLLEQPSLRHINLIGCDNILRYFDDCGGCNLLQASVADGEKLLKISPNLKSFSGQVTTLVGMFKEKYSGAYIEKSDNFLLLSSKGPVKR